MFSPASNTYLSGLAAVASATLILAGCSSSDSKISSSLSSQEIGIQSSAAGNLAVNQGIESSVDALIADATGGDSRRGTAVGAPVVLVIDVATLKKPDGTAKFPNASGRFTVTADGAIVNSWPTATVTTGTATVSVDFSQPAGSPLTINDPTSGIRAVISAGTISLSVASSYTYAGIGNWVLNVDTTAVVPPSLSCSLTKGGATTTTQLSGNRQVQTTLTRATLAAPLRSTLTVRRVIKGTATNPRDATETNKFTQWTTTATTAGVTDTVIWNRNADFTITYDLLGATATPGTTSDRIFVTYNGIVVGPYTAAQIASRLSTALQDPSAF